MKKQIFTFLFVTFLSGELCAANTPQAITQNLKPNFLIGESDLKYFGFKVYRAELWCEKAQFSYDKKFAIHLTYNMNFAKEDLARRSIEEIEKLHILGDLEKKNYYQQLLKIFANVKKGDEKVALFLPQKGVEMYYNNKLIGKINDLKLARLFVDIWLDKRGSFPQVTKKLLGKND